MERNLVENEQKLLTVWDLYKTLKHLASFPRGADKLDLPKGFADYFGNDSPIYSLLADRIPANRTCTDARIPARFCACQDQKWFSSAPFV